MLLFLDKKGGFFSISEEAKWVCKGTCKWKESGLNLVNYIERVSETGKLTMLCRTCVCGITETKQTKHEKVKGYLR